MAQSEKIHYDEAMPSGLFSFLRFLILLIFCSASPALRASTESDWSSLNSPFMRVLQTGEQNTESGEVRPRYPWFADPLSWSWAKYSPRLEAGTWTGKCDWRQWKEPLAIGDVWSECEKQYQTGVRSGFGNVYGAMMIAMDPERYALGRNVMFTLGNGERLLGFLALKPGSQRRPLVIFRGGILSSAREFYSERFALLTLFEQSPFHFLFLESTSGQEFITRNRHVSFAGYEESLQNIELAQQLATGREPFSPRISSVHMAAISLGGHGAFRAVMKRPELFKSVTLFCPLMDLPQTMQYHQSNWSNNKVISYWMQKRLSELPQLYPQLKQSMTLQDLSRLLSEDLQQRLKLDYWKESDWWNDFKNISTPIRIFASETDSIVPFSLNTGRILSGAVKFPNTRIEVFPMTQGNHCTISGAYQIFAMSEFFQALIRETSRLKRSDSELKMPISGTIKTLFDEHPNARWWWKPVAGRSAIRIYALNDRFGDVINSSSWWAQALRWIVPMSIVDWITTSLSAEQDMEIPLEMTDYKGLELSNPNQLPGGEQALHRWLIQNVNLKRNAGGDWWLLHVRRYR